MVSDWKQDRKQYIINEYVWYLPVFKVIYCCAIGYVSLPGSREILPIKIIYCVAVGYVTLLSSEMNIIPMEVKCFFCRRIRCVDQ